MSKEAGTQQNQQLPQKQQQPQQQQTQTQRQQQQQQQKQQQPQQSDNGEWKKLHDDMVAKMRIEKLYEALKRREREQLEIAIGEAKAAGVDMGHEAFYLADRELEILGVKDELQAAVAGKQPSEIRAAIQKICRTHIYLSRLQPDIAEANRELDRIERLHKLQPVVMDMNRKTMGELRCYHHPPKVVKEVMRGVLLLFGLPEEYTEKWINCQKQLQPNGPNGMNVKILNYDINTVHPEIAARCSEILEEHPLSEVQDVSPGAAAFYIWARGVLEEILPKSKIQVKPADKKRQKEILPPPPPARPPPKLPESPRRRRKANPNGVMTPRN